MDLSILIIEDEEHLLEVYARFCELHFAHVYCAPNIKEAIHILNNYEVNVLLADNYLPDGKGIDLIKKINQHDIKKPAILLTGGANKELAIEAANNHVFNFLEKPVSYTTLKEIFTNITNHIKNQKIYDNVFESYTLNQTAKKHLMNDLKVSSREIEIIELALQPYDNKTIGSILFISPGTVKRHLENIFTKFGINSRSELRQIIKEFNKLEAQEKAKLLYKIAPSSTTSKYP